MSLPLANAPRESSAQPAEISVLRRGLNVLRCIAGASQPMRSDDIAATLKISKASANRITNTFISLGLLSRDPSTMYLSLTAYVVNLASGYLQTFDIRTAIKSHLEWLAENTGGTLHLGVRDNFDMVVIQAVRPGTGVFTSRIDMGSRLGLRDTAMGLAYLGLLPEQERASLIANMAAAHTISRPSAPFSARATEVDSETLEQALEALYSRGFAIGSGSFNSLVGAVAVPLIGPTGERYAICCSGPIADFRPYRILQELGPMLVARVKLIAEEIGGQTGSPPNS
jgi:DNA-binding IclR family transcriptional regulator